MFWSKKKEITPEKTNTMGKKKLPIQEQDGEFPGEYKLHPVESGVEYPSAAYVFSSNILEVSDIAFRMPTRDWEKLEKSDEWLQVCRFLSGVQKGYSQMFPTIL